MTSCGLLLVQKEAKSRQKAQQQQELDAIVREMEADTKRKKEEQAAQKRDKAAQKQARKTPPSQPEPEPADDGFTVPEMSMEAKVKARQEERLHSDRMAAMRQEQKDRERKIVETEVENAVRIMCLLDLVYVARRAAGIAPPSQQSCSGE